MSFFSEWMTYASFFPRFRFGYEFSHLTRCQRRLTPSVQGKHAEVVFLYAVPGYCFAFNSLLLCFLPMAACPSSSRAAHRNDFLPIYRWRLNHLYVGSGRWRIMTFALYSHISFADWYLCWWLVRDVIWPHCSVARCVPPIPRQMPASWFTDRFLSLLQCDIICGYLEFNVLSAGVSI